MTTAFLSASIFVSVIIGFVVFFIIRSAIQTRKQQHLQWVKILEENTETRFSKFIK